MGKRRRRLDIDILFDDDDSPSAVSGTPSSSVIHQHTDFLPDTGRLRTTHLYHELPASPTKPSTLNSSPLETDIPIMWNIGGADEQVDTESGERESGEREEPRKRKRTAGVSKPAMHPPHMLTQA